ncbi:UDP-N-acetylglucosamine 2-epimerase [Candidatus Gugararchaeum adminiculabundum]|nr:UDP-N-acetylglucosamine 2-epimerase [Candidatus Gugararchaeum adminiculabundum]
MAKIATVFGTRPEIIKMSRLIPLLDARYGKGHKFYYTSQHFSKNMMDVFFQELGVRAPDKILQVNSSEVDKIVAALQPEFEADKPELVVVYGDTNSTLASAIAAKNAKCKLAHVEAGLRSFDKKMPEEKNRLKIDRKSDYLFAPTELQRKFLELEKAKGKIFVVGNTVVDACLHYVQKSEGNPILHIVGVEPGAYILLTAHRQENVDRPKRIVKLLHELATIGQKIVFPMHPRTKKMFQEKGIKLPENIRVIDAVGYLEFLKLMKNASVIITDSGGVQEEAVALKVPCLTIRESTERWEAIEAGGNFLVGLEPRLCKYYVKMILESGLGAKMRSASNPYGDGTASKKIDEKIAEIIK